MPLPLPLLHRSGALPSFLVADNHQKKCHDSNPTMLLKSPCDSYAIMIKSHLLILYQNGVATEGRRRMTKSAEKKRTSSGRKCPPGVMRRTGIHGSKKTRDIVFYTIACLPVACLPARSYPALLNRHTMHAMPRYAS